MPTIAPKGPLLGVNKAKDAGQLTANEAADALNLSLSSGTATKRDGYIRKLDFSSYGSILGMYNYLKVSGSSTQVIHLIKSAGSLFAASDWVATDLSVSLSTTELACFTTMNNRCYLCDGSAFKVTDGTSSYNAAIAQPAAVTAAASASGGVLSGVYDYKVTFYSSTWGQESPASDASSSVTVAAKKIDLSDIPVSVDGRVGARRIYRRKTSSGQTDWFFIAEISDNTTTTYEDNILESDVNTNLLCPLSYSTSVPNFRYLEQQGNVLFLAGDDTNPTFLYYTLVDQPWAVQSYLPIGSGSDTDPITGLAAYLGVLVIFKQRSIYVLSGNSRDTFYVRKVHGGVGCRGHHSIVNAGDYLYFLAEDGFWFFDGTNVAPVSGAEAQDPIRPDITARNYARDKYVVGVHDPDRSMILWLYSGADSASTDKGYAYFYEHSARTGYPCWVPWSLGAIGYAARLCDPDDRQYTTFVGTEEGYLCYLGGNDDDGSQFTYYWKTGEFDGGAPHKFKIWKELEIEFEPQSASSLINVNYYLNGSASSVSVGQHDMTAPVLRARIGVSSRQIALEFTGSSAQPAELATYSLEYEVAGRA